MKRLSIKALWPLLFFVVLLLIPLNGSWQGAFSPDLARLQRLTGMTPSQPLTSVSPLRIEVPIDTGGSAFATQTLGFLIGTNARKNHCSLWLELAPDLVSDALPCEGLRDNEVAAFKFPRTIADGVYQGTFHSTAGSDADSVAIYTYERATHERVGAALRLVEGRWSFGAFERWLSESPRRAGLYMAGTLVLIGAAWLLPLPRVAAVVLLYLLHSVIAPYFSGYDETAHIEMLEESLRDHTAAEQTQFHVQTNQLMRQANFFRANPVMAHSPEDCPHRILFNCGETKAPMWLYKRYARALNLFFSPPDMTPRTLMLALRILNLILLVVFLSSIALLGGPRELHAQSTLLLFCGALLSQMASITNDVPMFFLGLWLTAAISLAIFGKSTGRAFLALAIGAVGLAIGKNIDVGWVAGIPLWFLGALCFCLRKRGRYVQDARGFVTRHPLLTVLVLAAVAHVCGRLIATPLSRALPDQVAFVKSMLAMVRPRGVKVALLRTVHNVFSFYGSFVWGHSVFSLPLYGALLAGGLYLAKRGAAFLVKGHGSALIILAAMALSLGYYAFMVDAIASYFQVPGVTEVAAVKVRFLVAGIGGLVMLPYLGLGESYKKATWAAPIGWIELGWLAALLLHFLPRFYLADYQ